MTLPAKLNEWTDTGTVGEHQHDNGKSPARLAYTRWYVVNLGVGRVWNYGYATRSLAKTSLLLWQVQQEHDPDSTQILKGDRLYNRRLPHYRDLHVMIPARSVVTDSTVTPSVKTNPHEMVDVIHTPLTSTVPALLLPAVCQTTRAAKDNAQFAQSFAKSWHGALTSQPASIAPHGPQNVIALPAPQDAQVARKREAQRQSWLLRSANAELPAPCRNAHNGVFRMYAEPLTLISPDDSFGGYFPPSDKMPDKLPTKIGLTSVRRIGHEVKPKVAVKGERWWERGSEFPMGDTSKIAKEYAAGR